MSKPFIEWRLFRMIKVYLQLDNLCDLVGSVPESVDSYYDRVQAEYVCLPESLKGYLGKLPDCDNFRRNADPMDSAFFKRLVTSLNRVAHEAYHFVLPDDMFKNLDTIRAKYEIPTLVYVGKENGTKYFGIYESQNGVLADVAEKALESVFNGVCRVEGMAYYRDIHMQYREILMDMRVDEALGMNPQELVGKLESHSMYAIALSGIERININYIRGDR